MREDNWSLNSEMDINNKKSDEEEVVKEVVKEC